MLVFACLCSHACVPLLPVHNPFAGRLHPVRELYLEDILEETGYIAEVRVRGIHGRGTNGAWVAYMGHEGRWERMQP